MRKVNPDLNQTTYFQLNLNNKYNIIYYLLFIIYYLLFIIYYLLFIIY
jgi:hypothetical protein